MGMGILVFKTWKRHICKMVEVISMVKNLAWLKIISPHLIEFLGCL